LLLFNSVLLRDLRRTGYDTRMGGRGGHSSEMSIETRRQAAAAAAAATAAAAAGVKSYGRAR